MSGTHQASLSLPSSEGWGWRKIIWIIKQLTGQDKGILRKQNQNSCTKAKKDKIINFQTELDKAYETPIAFEYLISLYLPIVFRIYVLL